MHMQHMSSRVAAACGTRLDVRVANVAHLPPGDVKEQLRGAGADREPGGCERGPGASAGPVQSRHAIQTRYASEERLLKLAALGDERAWEALMRRHQAYLQACCRPIVGESCAQDAVQQAFVSAWRSVLRGCEVRNVRAWLATIARRAALQMLREDGPREQPLARSAAAEQPTHDQHELLARARAALAAVATLPAQEREALVWTSLQGRSTRETASALGVSEGALRQLVFRARARARAAVGGVLPSTLLDHLYRLIAHGGRRVGRGPRGGLPAPLAVHAGEGLARLAPLLAAAALVGAPLAVLDLAAQSAGRATKPVGARHEVVSPPGERRTQAATHTTRAPTRARVASPPAERGHPPAASAGAYAPAPAPRVLAAGDAPSARAPQRPSGNQGTVAPAITERVPQAPPAPGGLPALPAPNAPALALPSVTGAAQPLANTSGQVTPTVTATTGALLEASRAAAAGAASALPAQRPVP
jgi:RNA polymerase sigma-70 factor (ECF subfamily)